MRPVALAALLTVAACGPDAPAPAPPAAVPAATLEAAPVPDADLPRFVLGGTQRRSPLDLTDPTVRAALIEQGRAHLRVTALLTDGLSQATDWRQAEDAAARLAGEVPPLYEDAYAQSVALRLTNEFLLDAPLDSAATAALIGHVQTLTRAGSPEGAVLLRALRRLEGRWDEGHRAAAARAAADRLGAEFAKRAACVDCTVEEALAGMWPETRRATEALLYDMVTVHRELMRIARRGAPMPA